MRYIIDIDNTIFDTPGNDYYKARPIQNRIDKINALYDEGNEITYWTGRGMSTGLDWTAVTINQLVRYGVKYDHILMNKPMYDIWIDDKAINDKEFFK